MDVLKYKKIFFSLSGVLIIFSIFSIFNFGLNLGIDFTGGSVLEFKNETAELTNEIIDKNLAPLELGNYSLRQSDDTFILRTKEVTEDEKNTIVESLGEGTEVERFSTVGPVLGNELRTKATVALLLVVIAVIFFIAYAFRKVSTPVSSWRYGFATIIALLHDIIITVGIFTFLGYLYGFEINALFITALLVILGYSINDTIVVFDRVRDNLNQIKETQKVKEFNNVLNKSFRQTIVRSINTSLTTLISLCVLFFIGIESIQGMILALIIGVILGTYSSIFLAIPLLSVLKNKVQTITKKNSGVENNLN
jgi:preprotein translocase subunit SecF